jgi:hypothetical protein
METKVCKKCGVEKLLCEFVKDKAAKNGFRNRCKNCSNEFIKVYNQKYYQTEQNVEKRKQSQKKYREKNIEKINQRAKIYRENNVEKIKESQKLYYWDNREKRLENREKWFEKNKEKSMKTQKQWQNNNKEKINEVRRENHHKKYQTDILYKLKINIRNRVKMFLKSTNFDLDVNRTYDIVGCSPDELRDYLSSKFTEGMSWENYGKWHIDHIIPISSANTKDDVCRLSHYTNLQPLWEKDNLKKGNKII